MKDEIKKTYEARISEIDLGGFGYLIIAIPEKSVTSIFRCRQQGVTGLSMDFVWGCKEILTPDETMRRYREHETKCLGEIVMNNPFGVMATAMMGAELIK